jgi:capsule polysaccharide modification protein KpsS
MKNNYIIAVNFPYSYLFNDILLEYKDSIGVNHGLYVGRDPLYWIYLPSFVHYRRYLAINTSVNISSHKTNRSMNVDTSDWVRNELSELYNSLVVNSANLKVLIYNDGRSESKGAISFCSDYDVDYFVFERGLFRNKSLTMDRKELGYDSAFRANYQKLRSKASLDSLEYRQENPLVRILYFVYFIYTSLFRKYDYYFSHKSFRSLIKIFLKKRKKKYLENLENSYLVVMQLEYDTSIVNKSEFASMQFYIREVEKSFYMSGSTDKSLIFCLHPLDVSSYDFDKRSKAKHGVASDELVTAYGVVTINSTVTIDALRLNLNLFSFGKGVYSNLGLCYEPPLHELSLYFQDYYKEDFTNERAKWLSMLVGNYQYQGDIFAYNKSDVRNLLKTIYYEN